MELGLILAVAAALLTNLASLLKHRGCQRADPVCIHAPLRSVRALAESPLFAAGWGLAAVAWLIHVAALSMAPISVVQAILAGGAVLLAVMAQRLFGDRIERRQWLALALSAAGLVMLALSLPRLGGSHSSFSTPALVAGEGALALVAAAIAIALRRGRLAAHGGIARAVVAGLLFTIAGVSIKALTGADAPLLLLAPWVVSVVVAGALAQYATVAALQRGGAIETIGLMGLVANALQIAAGVLVFGDPLSASPVGLVMQATAFGMVCASALLMPAREGAMRPAFA
jgi:drug/metabolite transporter (DMT)-like permease